MGVLPVGSDFPYKYRPCIADRDADSLKINVDYEFFAPTHTADIYYIISALFPFGKRLNGNFIKSSSGSQNRGEKTCLFAPKRLKYNG